MAKVVEKDARWQRSRKQLEAAVLELAAEQDISSSSVLELTRRAGVNRTTFYAHADSPVDLLVQILSRELKEILDQGFKDIKKSGGHRAELSDRIVLAILDHVISHERIYARSEYKSSQFAFRSVIYPLMIKGVHKLFDQNLVKLPSNRRGDKDSYAAFITGGVISAIETWICSKRRASKQLLEIINSSYPKWFLKG